MFAVPTDAHSPSTNRYLECIIPRVYWYTFTPAESRSPQKYRAARNGTHLSGRNSPRYRTSTPARAARTRASFNPASGTKYGLATHTRLRP